MTLATFNAAAASDAADALHRCCSCAAWVTALVAGRPYPALAALRQAADDCWGNLEEQDYLEAFAGHPQIGDVATLRAKYADTRDLAAAEQAGVAQAGDAVIEALAQANAAYLERFGFIFIICATGLGADEMLQALRLRLGNSRAQELQNAAEEQRKIFQLRLGQLT